MEGPAASPRTHAPALRLWVEFCVLYVAVPAVLLLVRTELKWRILPIIWLAGLGCWIALRRDPSFDRQQLWNTRDFGRHLRRSLVRLAWGGALVPLFTWWHDPRLLLSLPLRMPVLWALVMVLYPTFSAYPQEVVFRGLFFHRYGRLFGGRRTAIVVGALAFGWAHAFLGTWIAVVFPALGGLFFGSTYLRSRSLLQSTIEHGLWGDFAFTIGLGWYFYAGSIHG